MDHFTRIHNGIAGSLAPIFSPRQSAFILVHIMGFAKQTPLLISVIIEVDKLRQVFNCNPA